MACRWRVPCGLSSVGNLKCPIVLPDNTNMFQISFDFQPSPCDQYAIFQAAVATAVNVSINNVQFTGCADSPKMSNSTRRLAVNKATVYSDDSATNAAVGIALKDPVFVTNVKAELAKDGVTGTQVVVGAPESNGFEAYAPSDYKPNDGVKGFAGFSKKGDIKFGNNDEYIASLVEVVIVSVVVGVLLLLFYFFFLCSKNCKCCHACNCCKNETSAWGGPKTAKFILVLLFALTTIAILTAFKGQKQWVDGLEGTSQSILAVSAVFKQLEADANVM